MSFSKYIIHPIIVAALAATIQALDQLLAPLMPPANNVGFGWIAFIAWAMYFMAGCDIKGSIRVFLNYVSGIVASIAIMTIGASLMPQLGFFGFPTAVFFVVIFCICLEKTEWFNFVPALFVGAGTFFGFMSYVPDATFSGAAITELTYCVVGLFYGWMTVTFRGKYDEYLQKEKHVEQPAH